MATRHLIIGGGTAGMNAIRTIREEEGERSEIALVSAETPYSRMVLPYYLDRSIAESHVFTATRSEEHTSELQSQSNIVCRLLLEKKHTSSDSAMLAISRWRRSGRQASSG